MNYRSAESARLVGIGLVSIVAIAVAASTIQSVTTAGGASVTGPGLNPPGVSGPGVNLPGVEGNVNIPTSGGPNIGIVASLQQCIQPLAAWYGGLVYFGAFGGVLYLFKRAYSTGAAVLGAYAVAPVAFLGYFLLTSCASFGGGVGGGGPNKPPGPPESPFVGLEMPLLVAGGVFGLALLAVGAVLYRSTGDQTVQTLADDLGMDEADVAELTELFEEVRYGRRDAASREERAVETLRSIETMYGDDGSDDAEGSDGVHET